MSEMIERVARALYGASPFRSEAGPYEAQTPAYRQVCEALARAAIHAMREPTEAMRTCTSETIPAYAWVHMIDAALAESPPR